MNNWNSARSFSRRPSHQEPAPEDELDDEMDFNSGFILPRLPKGKKMVDTVVSTDVDSLYKVSWISN